MGGIKTSSKSALFLIEFIIAVAFFAITSAVCMQLFVKAHSLSTRSDDLSAALNVAQSAAEFFKVSEGSAEKTAVLLNSSCADNSSMIVYYDKLWKQTVSVSDAYYSMEVVVTKGDGKVNIAEIDVQKLKPQQHSIYSLEAKKYVGEGG